MLPAPAPVAGAGTEGRCMWKVQVLPHAPVVCSCHWMLVSPCSITSGTFTCRWGRYSRQVLEVPRCRYMIQVHNTGHEQMHEQVPEEVHEQVPEEVHDAVAFFDMHLWPTAATGR